MKKFLSVVTLLLLAITCLFVGCKPNTADFKLQLQDELFREELYIHEEYSVDNIVVKESGATYTFDELFYVDDNFERHDIEHKNGKFTQDAPYNVTAVVKGTKNGKSDTAMVELKINFSSNPYYNAWMNAWVDVGVVRSLVANEEYLTGEAESALAIRYLGEYNPAGNGVCTGSIGKAYADFDVENWSNPVLTMDVYNAAEYDLQIGFQITADSENYDIIMLDKLTAGEWTKVTWSFRAHGYGFDFFENGGFSIKVRAIGGASPYDYTFYVCNIEMTDYDAERFPDLETRTNAEIKQEMYETLEGDELDKKLAAFTTNDSNYTVTTDTTYTYSEESTSSLKYTYTKDGFTGNPTSNRANLMVDDHILFEEFEIEYFDNMYLSFYLKNMTGVSINMNLRFATQNADGNWRGTPDWCFGSYSGQNEIWDITGDWVLVKFSLAAVAKAAGFEYHTENVKGLKLCLCTEISRSDVGSSVSYYIDDMKLYSEKSLSMIQNEQYENSTGDEVDRKLAAYAWGHSAVYSSETDISVKKVGDSSIKYTFTRDNSSANPTVYRASFLDDSSNIIFDQMGNVDWSTAYIGFWIKGDTSLPGNQSVIARFQNTQDGTKWKGCSSMYFSSYTLNVSFGTDWKYIEFSLKEICDALPDGENGIFTEGVTGLRIVLSTEIVSAEGVPVSFWIDGLNVYNKASADEFDTKALNAFYNSGNYAVEVNTNADYVKEGLSSLKYTYVKNSGTAEPASNANRGRFLYYTSPISATADMLGVNSDLDWSKDVYVGFWYKQEYAVAKGDVNMAFRMQNYNGTSWTTGWEMSFGSYKLNKNLPNKTEWQFIEINLTSGISDLHKSGVTEYRFSLNTEITADDAVFYIDQLSIYNKIVHDDFDTKAIEAFTNSANYAVEINDDVNYVKDGFSSLKFTWTKSDTISAPTKNRGTALYYVSDFSSDLLGVTADTFKEDVYVGFWFKQKYAVANGDVNIAVRIQNTTNGTTWNEGFGMDFGSYKANRNLPNNTEWQFVEFNLSSLVTDLIKENVTQYRFALVSEIVAPDAVYYIDGLSIYNKFKDDLKDATLISKASASGATVTTDSSVAKVGNESIKITLTGANNNKFLRKYSENTSTDLYNLYKDDITDWSDVRIGFWILNTEKAIDINMYFGNVQDGDYSTYKGYGQYQYGDFSYATNKNVLVSASNEWQYIEVSFAGVELYTENVQNIAFGCVTHATGITIHIDGFGVYSGTRVPA